MTRIVDILMAAALTVVGTIMGVLYTQGHMSLRDMLLSLATIGAVAILLLTFPSLKRILGARRVRIEDIEATLEKFKDGNGRQLFQISPEELVRLKSHMAGLHTWQKPTVFYEIRLKAYVNWVDAIYWTLLRDLSSHGLRVIALVQDFEYFGSEDNKVRTHVSLKDYLSTVTEMKTSMRKLLGPSVKLTTAREFYPSRRGISNFVASLYADFIPAVASILYAAEPGGAEPVGHPRAHDLRHSLGLVIARSIRPKDLLMVLVWEARLPLWQSVLRTRNPDSSTFAIVGKTISSSPGNPVDTRHEGGSLNLDQVDEHGRHRLDELDTANIHTLARCVTNRDDWDDGWLQLSDDVLKDRVEVGLRRLDLTDTVLGPVVASPESMAPRGDSAGEETAQT